MTLYNRLVRMTVLELELLQDLCIRQSLCKTAELELFFLVLLSEVEKVIKRKKK